MGSEPNIKVTEQESEYRTKYYRDIRAIKQREWFCCSCGNVLSQIPGRVYSHPTFNIFQCENCRDYFEKVSFSSDKTDSVRPCRICGRERKTSYGCKKQDCPYDFCKSCIIRNIPKSLVDAESGKWKCFACNTQPLWKLRGACAAVMNSLPKRTKTKKVKSRNRSSDSEDNTSDLRNISYVRRSRLEESKKLSKRLRDVCDAESPVQPDEPRLLIYRQSKRVNPDNGSVATAIGAKHAHVDGSSRHSGDLVSSSEDSDLDVRQIFRPRITAKSHSEREKRYSKNALTSAQRRSRNREARKSVHKLESECSSDDDSDLEKAKHFRKSKSHGDDNSSSGWRKDRASMTDSRENSANESRRSDSENKRTNRKTMSSTRKSNVHKKDAQRGKQVSSGNEVTSESESSSDDSDIEAIKSLMPSAFAKGNSYKDKKSIKKTERRKEYAEDERKISKSKSRVNSKSLESRSSDVRSKFDRTNTNSQDRVEADSCRKKSSMKSPGPKSFKEGRMPRRELSPSSDEDSVRRNKQKRKSAAARSDSENGEDRATGKSTDRRHLKIHRQTSDSSSGKEFKKSKVLRSSFVALRRIRDIEEDLTTSPKESPDKEGIITKDQTFSLKNSVNGFWSGMKIAAVKLLSDIENVQKTYCMKDSMRVEEANRMILETKNVVKRFSDIVEKSDNKLNDRYDKWCVKTKVKNVLRRPAIDEEKPSTSKPGVSKATKTADESGSESAGSTKNATSVSEYRAKSPASTLANSEKIVVVSECESDDIFSADESRISTRKSSATTPKTTTPAKNDGDENIEASKDRENERNSRDPTPDESENVVASSDMDVPDNEVKLQSPTMSEFSGRSDSEERPAVSESKLQEKTALSGSEENAEDMHVPSELAGDRDASNRSSEKEECKAESEKSSNGLPKVRRSGKIECKVAVLDSDSETEGSKKAKRTSPKATSRLQYEQSDSEAPAAEKSVELPADDRNENNEEILNTKEKNPAKVREKLADEDAVSAEPENPEKVVAEDPLVEEKEQSEVESNMSCDIASVSTELLSCSPEKSLDEMDDEHDNLRTNDAGDYKKMEAEGEAVEGGNAESPKEPSSPKLLKKVDSARRSDSVRRSSSDTVLADEFDATTEKDASSRTSGNNNSSANSDVSETQNARAREALLVSSSSDNSTGDERESAALSTPKDSNNTPPTPPESDSKSDKSLAKKDSAESIEKMRKKRSKFRPNDNRHYMADDLLKRKCVVHVERLNETILDRYSRALRKSRDYVESKNLKRLVTLNNLDKDHKKATVDTSGDENKSSSNELRRKKAKARSAKEREETLLDHLNKVEIGENVEMSSGSDAESSTTGNKEEAKDKGDDRLLIEANKMAKKRLLESSDSGADEQPASEAKDEEPTKTKKVVKKEKLAKSSEDEKKKQEKYEKSHWRKNKILTSKISDSDSGEELKKYTLSQEKLNEKKEKQGSQSETDEEDSPLKKKKTRVRRRVLHSDSDVKISSEKSDSDSDSSVQSIKKKKKKKGESSDDEKDQKKTRKRTRRRRSSDSSSSIDERPKPTRRKRIKKTAGSDSDSENDSSQGSPGKSGRKNIRKVLRDKQVAEDTKQAAKEEEERLKRIAERQKLYNEMYEVRLAGEEKVDKLVLDFNEETKEPLVSVEEGLVKRLKPHQAQGIKFMWDACFESLERIKSTKGSGCILAHCMGLGKTFQVVTLAHTLLMHSETGINTVLVVCPLSTVLNWANEFKIWLADIENGDDIEVYEMTKMKKNFERKFQLTRWQETGGVMIIGYEMFRNLTQQSGRKVRKNIQESFLKCLVDPGPDLIVCDEGHLLKNEDTALSKAMRRVKTLRRVVLTGTPLQNNLIEYHCMVQFVKPNLLGTKKEFMNRFENPITNGQFDDSTEYDVKLMKKRAHILHKLLEGSVQRFDYSVLTPFLPPKQEYVIFVKLTKIQIDMYEHYLANYARKHRGVGGSLFADFQALQRIWTHPMVMQMNAEKVERANEKKRQDASDSEGSLRDFIDDGSDTSSTSNNSSDDGSEDEKTKKPNTKRATRANPVPEEPIEPVTAASEDATAAATDETQWWSQYVKEDDYSDIRCSSKLLILFRILKESEQIGDKLLVFSQSLYSLTLIERFLELIDEETQKGNELENLDRLSGSWALGLDYFRLDGQTSADNRRRWCDIFNKPSNTRARLFLISTRAGGLGINLTAANRVVIFDASWNPSHDVQSIFRIYRFGQKKPCYVYRLLAAGTMEEKIYNRQVTKLSLSCRVVDEQQIERHYSNNALAELYKLELPSETEITLKLPRDRLLAEIFLQYKCAVENYHEHDSLLENQAGEELDEEERKQAWLEYEEEKKGKRMMPPVSLPNYNDPILIQQINMLQRLMEKDYPGTSEAQQKIMASRSVYEMYNYVEKQAMANHGAMHLSNLGAITGAYNNQIGRAVNTGQTYMDILRMQQQQQQVLAQQQNGQIMFANNQQQLRADILRQQQQIQYAQQSHLQGQSSAITIDDDDVMEV